MWFLVGSFLSSIILILFADSIIDKLLFMTQIIQKKRDRGIPGPLWRWPLVGHRPLVRAKGGLAKATHSLSKELQSDVVGLYTCGNFSVTACTHDTVKEILTKPEFQARPNNYFTYLRSMKTNKGITMTDGQHWQEQRSFLVKQLSEVGFGRNLMNDMIEDNLKSLLRSIGEGGPEVDLSPIISKSVINILWRIVTGKEIPDNKLTELTSLMRDRSKAFDQAGGWLAQMPWLRHIFPEWTGYNIIMKINKQLKKLITDTIQEHKDSYQPGVTRDFIDAYLHRMHESTSPDSTFTDDQLMMVCLDLFIGGIMTTSNSLDFCFLRMVHHPDVQAKAQAELDSMIGNKLPTVEDRKRLPYIRAVINECLRLTMISPVNGPRRAIRSTTLGGHMIRQGTTVFMNMIPISMDEEKFPEPDMFKPERFLDVNENDDDSNAGQSYAFGFGKRRCPGEVLARNYMFTILAGILHQYNLGPPHRRPVPTLQPNLGITHTPKPYRLSLAKRIRIRSTIF